MSKNHSENEEINEKVHMFYIGFDLLDDGYGQVKKEFYDELFNDIPAFAFGTDVLNAKAEANGIVPTVREAMKKLYSIKEIQDASKEYLNSTSTEDKYLKRGEFGELLLYHFLHEYFNADALISKIYFKDSAGVAAHGFDAVHVDVNKKIMWLGESKLYIDPKTAIRELVNDVNNHFCIDFLNSEFQIITNRVHDSKKQHDDYILKILDPNTKTLDKLAQINIALFAGFESSALKSFDKISFLDDLKQEVIDLEKRAQNQLKSHSWYNNMNIFNINYYFNIYCYVSCIYYYYYYLNK